MENIFFNTLNLSEEILDGINKMGFTEPTEVQREAILPVLYGNDVVVQAPTGTGKTCAFGIPVLENTDGESKAVEVVVLCPTRELVMQTCEELSNVARYKKGIKIVPVYGGQPIDKQIVLLKRKPQIIVATPGRLMDHLRRKTIKLKDLKVLVLDEADEMLNMGFREDLDVILETAPKERQTIMFSATMPKEIRDIAEKYQKDDTKNIKITKDELTVSTVKQYYLEVKQQNRIDAICRLIDANKYSLCMVFLNTKKKVDEICAELRQRKYPADSLHGDMKQMQRDRVMSRFKKGITGILVATDVAARGIDVDGVDAVFNFELPEDFEYYVHRIGRTGRANNEGASYTFVSGREVKKLKELAKYTKGEITLITPPSLKEVKKVNLQGVMEDTAKILSDGSYGEYKDYVNDYCEKNNILPSDLAGALLKMLNEGNKTEEKDVFSENKKMTRLFINLGKLDKMGTNNMLEILLSTGVEKASIGKIDIMEKFSFVEVDEDKKDIILEILNGSYYKKRKISIETANKRDEKSKQKKSTDKKPVKNSGKKPRKTKK